MSETKRGPIPLKIIRELQEKYGYKCPICGRDDVKLDVCHITPLSKGGDSSIDNLVLLCPSCHLAMDQETDIRGWEFIQFLGKLLGLNNRFRNIRFEMPVSEKSSYIADIVAEEMVGSRWQKIVIECKVQRAFTLHRMKILTEQMVKYRRLIRSARLILAFPGRLSIDSKSILDKQNIDVWDILSIADIFREQIPLVPHPRLQPLFMSKMPAPTVIPEEKLIQQLKTIPPGRPQWSRYQKFTATVLERLFCPPLASPIPELSDYSGVNRRDIILPNYAEEGFWAFARSVYCAFYIVVDAKNYVDKVGKDEVLQLSNYLKEHGAGLFGMIVCRNGGNDSCEHTLREIWGFHKKLILVLSDDDMEQMLLAKSANGHPEAIIRQKIEEFRLSL